MAARFILVVVTTGITGFVLGTWLMLWANSVPP